MKKILITGTSGFIASYLYNRFSEDGYEVLGLDKKKPKDSRVDKFEIVNILDKKSLENVFQSYQPEIVLHLAARIDLGEGDTIDNFQDNTIGTKNIVDVCNETQSVEKLLFTSTILVLPRGVNPKSDTHFDPKSPYGESKMIGEQYIRENLKADWIVIRPTSIWGPSSGSHYQIFFDKIFQKRYFNISGYDPKITFGFLGNFYYQIFELLNEKDSIGNIYYIGDYKPVRVRYWAKIISQAFNNGEIKSLPYFAVKLLALIGDLLFFLFKYKGFPMNSYRLKNLITDRVYNLEKTSNIAPNLPFTLEEAVTETVNWYKKNRNK